MQSEFEKMDLNNVGDGALASAFESELAKVLADFDDEHKKTGDKRTISLSVEFTMDEDGRVNLVCASSVKLAARRRKKSFALLRDGKLLQYRDLQEDLAMDGTDKVTAIGGGRG